MQVLALVSQASVAFVFFFAIIVAIICVSPIHNAGAVTNRLIYRPLCRVESEPYFIMDWWAGRSLFIFTVLYSAFLPQSYTAYYESSGCPRSEVPASAQATMLTCVESCSHLSALVAARCRLMRFRTRPPARSGVLHLLIVWRVRVSPKPS